MMDLIVRMLETAAQQKCSLLFGSGGAGWASVVRATWQNQQKQWFIIMHFYIYNVSHNVSQQNAAVSFPKRKMNYS